MNDCVELHRMGKIKVPDGVEIIPALNVVEAYQKLTPPASIGTVVLSFCDAHATLRVSTSVSRPITCNH